MDDLSCRHKSEESEETNLFVVVYGAARTGTSLCMDLVKAAGFNAGKYNADSLTDNRRGRNEHGIFGKEPDIGSLRTLEQEQITCAKIIGFDKWITWLDERFNIKILAPYRLKETRQQSIRSRCGVYRVDTISLHGHVKHPPEFSNAEAFAIKKTALQDGVLAAREKLLSRYDHLKVSFEKLIDKDVDEFITIAKFLNCSSDVLMNCVDRERVKFHGSKAND